PQRAGKASHFEAEMAVHGAGRVPEIDDLDLETAGIARDKRGVTVNEYLQSVSNPAVYAAGDAAASGPPLTPTASHAGEVVAADVLAGNHRQPNYAGIASVVFAVPAVAPGRRPAEPAPAQGLQVRTHEDCTAPACRSLRRGD